MPIRPVWQERQMRWNGMNKLALIHIQFGTVAALHMHCTFIAWCHSFIPHCIALLRLMPKLKSAAGSVVVDALSCWFVTISVSFRSGRGSLYSMTSSVWMPLNSRPMPAYLSAPLYRPAFYSIYPFYVHMHFWLRNKDHNHCCMIILTFVFVCGVQKARMRFSPFIHFHRARNMIIYM